MYNYGKRRGETYMKENGNDKNLLEEALSINERQVLLMKDAKFNFKLVCEWLNKHYKDDSKRLSIAERESLLQESKVLWSRLRISVSEMKKLDEEYNGLCVRVNTYYNKELMKPVLPMTEFDTLLNEIWDTDDWWKNES